MFLNRLFLLFLTLHLLTFIPPASSRPQHARTAGACDFGQPSRCPNTRRQIPECLIHAVSMADGIGFAWNRTSADGRAQANRGGEAPMASSQTFNAFRRFPGSPRHLGYFQHRAGRGSVSNAFRRFPGSLQRGAKLTRFSLTWVSPMPFGVQSLRDFTQSYSGWPLVWRLQCLWAFPRFTLWSQFLHGGSGSPSTLPFGVSPVHHPK